jgi:hypothetical protein
MRLDDRDLDRPRRLPPLPLQFRECTVDPFQLSFLPIGRWQAQVVTIGELVTDFFGVRSSRVLRFEHKLWNALALTKCNPHFYAYIGVKWVTPTILKVNRDVFGSFINVTRPAAALYNKQGSLATHGFREVPLRAVAHLISFDDRSDIDESVVRVFEHATPLFNIFFADPHLRGCRYARAPL